MNDELDPDEKPDPATPYLFGQTEGAEPDDGNLMICLEHSATYIYPGHEETTCAPHPCAVHNRTEHHMRMFPQVLSGPSFHRVCPHGEVHPDPDENPTQASIRHRCSCDCCEEPAE